MGDYSLPMLPVPLENMTRDSLRMFIPRLICQVEGITKLKLGKESQKPPWWPDQVPWTNIRNDTRTDPQKNKVGWTEALRDVVKRCYQYYGGEYMLSSKKTPGPDSPIKVVNNVDGSVSFITDKAVVTLEQISKSKFAGGVPSRLEIPTSPTEISDVPVPTHVFQNLQDSTVLSKTVSVEVFICCFCEKQFQNKSSLHDHQSYCIRRPLQLKKYPVKKKLNLIPVDEMPRADRKSFISTLNLIPQSKARIMKKQQNKNKDIEVICIDSEDNQSLKSPTTPKTPKSLISQLSRDLSPPGKGNRRKSLMSAFDYEEEKELSETESVKSEAQKSENDGKPEIFSNRSVLSIDVSSNLGYRVRKLMQRQAEQTMSSLLIDTQEGYEQFCHTPKKNEALARLRIRNSEHLITFRKTRKTCPKYAHQYKFKSSQRKEWYLTSLCGLNARSRELKKLTKKCSVKLYRLSKKEIEKWKRKRSMYERVSQVSNGQFSFSQTKQNSLQNLLSGKIVTSPDGKQFLLPNMSYNSGQRILLPNAFTQQRIILPKLNVNDMKGNINNNIIDLTPPTTPEQPRPVQLIRHAEQQSNNLKKLLQKPLKQRLEPYQSKSPTKQSGKTTSAKRGHEDVICLSSDEESESPVTKPPPAKRPRVESKNKSGPTLLFKCHLCHNELTCHGNFAGYIENHFAEAHSVRNIQLIEHVDSKGQKVVSIVEKVGKKKGATPASSPNKVAGGGNGSGAQKNKTSMRNNVVKKNSQSVKTKANSSNVGRRRLNNTSDIICID